MKKDFEDWIEFQIDSEKKLAKTTDFMKTKPGKFYQWKIKLIGLQGNNKSSFLSMFFFDEKKKEITRRIRYISDFSGKIQEYIIRAISPPNTTFVKLGIRVNLDHNYASNTTIRITPEKNWNLKTVEEKCSEIFDDLFTYEDFWTQFNENEYWTIVGAESKEEYDELAEQKIIILKEFGFGPNSNILDIGCGTGSLIIKIQNELKSTTQYVGTDLIYKAIDYCKKKFPEYEFYQNSMTTLPQLNKKFDLVVLFSVFSHMKPDEIQLMLKQIFLVLKPDGKVIATVPISQNIDRFSGTRHGYLFNEKCFIEIVKLAGFNKIESYKELYNKKHKSPHKVFCLTKF